MSNNLLSVSNSKHNLKDNTDHKFQRECLTTHNKYRAKHGGPLLTTNPLIIAYAKRRCLLVSQKIGLTHGHAGLLRTYGENLFRAGTKTSKTHVCAAAVDAWYNEIKDYNYNNPGFDKKTGHFTQLIWKKTGQVGCSRCSAFNGKLHEIYVACNYKEPGNVPKKYQDNVMKPK